MAAGFLKTSRRTDLCTVCVPLCVQSLAEEVSKQLPGSEGGSVASRWEQQPWFQEVGSRAVGR